MGDAPVEIVVDFSFLYKAVVPDVTETVGWELAERQTLSVLDDREAVWDSVVKQRLEGRRSEAHGSKEVGRALERWGKTLLFLELEEKESCKR